MKCQCKSRNYQANPVDGTCLDEVTAEDMLCDCCRVWRACVRANHPDWTLDQMEEHVGRVLDSVRGEK